MSLPVYKATNQSLTVRTTMATTKGKGNFADDPERARQAGKKGGQSRGKDNSSESKTSRKSSSK